MMKLGTTRAIVKEGARKRTRQRVKGNQGFWPECSANRSDVGCDRNSRFWESSKQAAVVEIPSMMLMLSSSAAYSALTLLQSTLALKLPSALKSSVLATGSGMVISVSSLQRNLELTLLLTSPLRKIRYNSLNRVYHLRLVGSICAGYNDGNRFQKTVSCCLRDSFGNCSDHF